MSNFIIKATTAEEALKACNKHRLSHKGEWVFVEVHLNDKVILLKSFDTSIQVLRLEGVTYPCGMDCSVKQWKEQINSALIAA
jgi:hypothetical protein